MIDRNMNTPAIVAKAEDSLQQLARHINEQHEQHVQATEQALDRARQAGALLIEVKDRLQHGQWLPWLRANCSQISERTARRYMTLARRWEEVVAKTDNVADLTYAEALRLLAEPTGTEAAEGDTCHDYKPLLELSPEARRNLAAKWCDILVSHTLYLDAIGWDAGRIADFWMVPVEKVAAILNPTPPERFDTPENGAVWLSPLAQSRYSETVEGIVAGILWVQCLSAAWVAEQEGRPDARPRIEALARHHERRSRRREERHLFDLDWPEEADGVIAYCCAGSDARAALGIEEPQPDLRTLWALFKAAVHAAA
jgi:hypothetical protein